MERQVEASERNTETKDSDAKLTKSVPKESIAQPRKEKVRKTLRKILKEDSSLSLLKVSATALTAVSMALISTQLTSVLNSLTLVALVSICSAIVSEFYRVILSVTSLGAKKVIAPIVLTNPDGTTTEIPVVVPEKVELPIELKSEIPQKRGIVSAIKRYFNRNPIMRMALLFTVISAITITANYFVTSAADRGDSVTNYTTVQEQPIKEITPAEKQAIIDDAVITANNNSETQKITLQDQINSLTEENAELKESLEIMNKNQESYSESILKVEAKLAELDRLISERSNDTGTTPTPSETPTVNPSPPTIAPPVIPPKEEIIPEVFNDGRLA